jgi:TP901 family phage tail tape measure protein
MAKNTQEAEVIVTLNGDRAKRAIKEMEQEYERLRNAALEARKAGDDALGDKLDAQARKLTRDMEITRRETKKFADVMKNINAASLKELRSAAKQLQSEINKLRPGTQQFIEKTKQLKDVNTRINQLTTSFKGLAMQEKQATFSLKGLADGFNKYFGMVTAGIAAITGVSMAFRKAAEDAARLDDTYADVMKTTGLLHEQVAELDQELMKINTRTSREQLLLLARDAGKLGIQGKDAILGFVRAADQIQVALGEDLGEGAIRNLGKIADVLGYTSSMGIEKSLLSIASSINAVGQASTASESYLVDFTQRMAGVAAQTGISAANIIGFASGLDQSAMKVEMASTAFQKFLMKLYEDPAKFAAYANLEVGKFTELLQNDANQAVITILKALKDQDGFASLVPIFKDMGLDGARAVSVLAAMATNINAVTEAQRLANVEFEKATSVTEEYNIKNNNLQANLEKARKEFQNASIALGQSLNPIMLKSTKLTTHLIKALATYGKEIKTVVITMAALTTAIKLQTIAQKGLNAANKLGQTIQKTGQTIAWAYRVVMMKLTGQTQLATFAQAELNKVMSASVFGLVATAVSVLVFGISRLVRNYREAAEAADWEATIEKKVNKEYAEQAGRVKALTAIVESNNMALSERKKALEELRNLVPDYHGDLTKEGRLINSNKEAIDEYCKSLRQMIRLQTHKDELQELEQQIIEKEDELEKARQKQRDALIKASGDTTESYSTLGGLKFTDYGKASGKVRVLEKELESLYIRENQISVKMGELTKGSVDGLTEEQREIEEVRKKYEQLFNDAKNAYVGAPSEGMKALGKLQEQMDEEIAAIKKKYAQVTEETTGSGSGGGLTDKELKKTYDARIEQIEQLQRREQNLINGQFFNRDITAEQHEEKLVEIKVKYLEQKKALAERYGQDTSAIEEQLLAAEVARHKFYYDKEMKLCEKRWMEEEIGLRQQLQDNAITQEEFDKLMLENKEKYLREQQELALGYNQDGSGIQLKDIEERQKEEEHALKQSLMSQKVTQMEYDSQMVEIRLKYLQQRLQLARQSGQDETAILQEILAAQVEAEELAMKQMAKLKEDAKKVIAGLDPSSARKSELDEQLKQLQVLHDAKLLSEQQYEEAVKQMRKKYADEDLNDKLGNIADYIDKANEMMEGASNFVTSLKEAESAKLEEQYQADLTAAGDNAERREQIEAEYEQKKLDLQKKYADTEMVINIAKTVANGAAAAVKAYLDGGVFAGPALAAMIAATTAVEVATIIAQRNAIKNASVNANTSTQNPTQNTGQRTITGYAEGGYTEDHTTLTTVGERGTEWVAPHWMLQENPVHFAKLERYRKAGSHGRSGSMSRGFADGGFTAPGTDRMDGVLSGVTKEDIRQAIYDGMSDALLNQLIRAYVVRKDITEIDNQDNRFKHQTSRG